jgi:hypothetical protein
MASSSVFRYACPHQAQWSGVYRLECLPVLVQVGGEGDVEDPHGFAVPECAQVWLGLGVGDRGLALLVGVVAVARVRAGGAGGFGGGFGVVGGRGRDWWFGQGEAVSVVGAG